MESDAVAELDRQGRSRLQAAREARVADLDRWLAGLLGAEPGVALVAVGSYGRGELVPGSDLDLVLLHDGRPDVAEVADRIWYPVWDAGISLDHSVRTVTEARAVARADMKAVLGLLTARRIAGDPALFEQVKTEVLADWRADAKTRLAELAVLTRERWAAQGELAFLLEGDLKEARGGLRDVNSITAVAAAWVAPGQRAQVRSAAALLLDVRHALHEVTGRSSDKLLLQEQEAVAQTLGLLDANVLLRTVAEAARTITYTVDTMWRQVDRFCRPGRGGTQRRPLADGIVEQGGEAVLARGADLSDPALVLRVAAAAAQAGVPIAPATVDLLAARATPMPVPWPARARDALVSLLGAGPPAIGVWEALDQAGLIVALLPDWERVRNRPQRNPVHRFTVDRHLVECAAVAAGHTREVSRPDLLLVGALLHDMGKGWPGDHSRSGAVVARDMGARLGFPPADVDILERLVLHHLLLPDTATRRDLDDPVTVATVADAAETAEVAELLGVLAIADGNATGPAAWGTWKAGLVAELTRRAVAVLSGGTPAPLPEPDAAQLHLVRAGGAVVRIASTRATQGNGPAPVTITIACPDRPGLLWQAAGVLALHRLVVRTARANTPHPLAVDTTQASMAVLEFTAVPEFGSPPDPAALEADLRRVLASRLDVAARLERRVVRVRPGVPVPPPRVTMVPDASATSTVIEVRAHDSPGLLWRIGQALGECALQVRAANVDTLGAEAVDVFYVLDANGHSITDLTTLTAIRNHVRTALTPK